MMIKKYVIGITGGIGTGKSICTAYLADKGLCVIDSDSVAHRIYDTDTELKDRIISEFDCGVLNDEGIISVDRKKLGSLVFSDQEKLHKLNLMTHPVIKKRIISLIEKQKKTVVLESAILCQSGFDDLTDEIWYVKTDDIIRAERVSERNSISIEEALRKIKAQGSYEETEKKADVIVMNNGSFEEYYRCIDAEYENLMKRLIK